MNQSVATPWKPLLLISIVGVLATACQQGGQPAQVAQQRETIQQETKACTAEEFRRLPFGLKWDCPPAGEVKLPIGTSQPVNIPKLLAEEDTKDAKRGGTLRRTAIAATSTGTEDVFRATCCGPWISVGETLIRRTAAPEFKLVPNLAESWEVSKDGLTYTFKVRKGVKFHDKPPADGRELEAKDIVDTYSYAMGWKHKDEVAKGVRFPRSAALANLEKVEALDKYTVKMTLSGPNGDFLIGLSDQRIGIFPEGLVEWNGGRDLNNFPKTAVATGPFVMVEHDTGVRTVWKKHPNYWDLAPDGKPYPYLDELRIDRVGDNATARAAFLAGQLDVLEREGDKEIDDMVKVRPNLKVVTTQGGPRTYNLINYKNTQYVEMGTVWTHQETRWAWHLVKDMCLYGQTIQPKSWRYQLYFGYWFEEARSQEELSMMPGLRCQTPEIKHQDRLKAVELLKAAGYAKGIKTLDYESPSTGTTGGANYVYGELMHADLNKVMVERYGLTDWYGRHKPGVIGAETARIEEQQLYDMRTQCSLNDVSVSVVLYADWYTGGGRNYEGHANNWNGYWKELWGLDNMTFDKMWQQQASELDPAKRMRLVRQIEHYLIWNMAWVPMNGSLRNMISHPYLMAYGPNWELGIDGGVEKAFKWAWLNK